MLVPHFFNSRIATYPKWEEDHCIVYPHSKPVYMICNATVALTKKRDLHFQKIKGDLHFQKIQESYESNLPAKTPLHATKMRDLKA